MNKEKRGVSPVIATVLLVVIVVAIGVIVFLWFKGMVGESVTKFGKDVSQTCGDVKIDAGYSNGVLSITNPGNTPIFSMKVKIVYDGRYETKDIKEMSSAWPSTGLGQGGIFSEDLSGEIGSAKTIVLIPVLLGTSAKGEKSYTCEEGLYGSEIAI